MKAIGNKVIFKANYTEKLKGGFIVPDSCKERNSSGLVVAVGSGKKDKPMEYKVGQTIYYIKNAGAKIYIDNDEYFVIDDFNILAKK